MPNEELRFRTRLDNRGAKRDAQDLLRTVAGAGATIGRTASKLLGGFGIGFGGGLGAGAILSRFQGATREAAGGFTREFAGGIAQAVVPEFARTLGAVGRAQARTRETIGSTFGFEIGRTDRIGPEIRAAAGTLFERNIQEERGRDLVNKEFRDLSGLIDKAVSELGDINRRLGTAADTAGGR